MSALLAADRVSVAFGGLRALSDVSLTAKAGKVTGLIGPNGAGKTTLFNAVSGFVPLSSGRITYDGSEIHHLPPHRRAALGIGRSFQNLGLMQDQTVATNLKASLHLDASYRSLDPLFGRKRVEEGERRIETSVARALGAPGLDQHEATLVADLSFAAARLVEIAGLLVARPRLLLLDEPTTGLDAAESAQLARVVRDAAGDGTTILVVAHDVGFIMETCDEVYVLAEGSLIYTGTPAGARGDRQVIESYLGSAGSA